MSRKCSRRARLHCVHDGRQAVCRRTAHVLSVYAQSETHVGIAIIRRESRGESVISRTLVCMCMLCSLWRNVCILFYACMHRWQCTLCTDRCYRSHRSDESFSRCLLCSVCANLGICRAFSCFITVVHTRVVLI